MKKLLFGSDQKTEQLLKAGAIIVDVRTNEEFASGHAEGSINIPLPNLENDLQKLKSKQVVLVCRSGMRASSAQNLLHKNGIVAHNAGAWQNVKAV